MIHVRHAAAAIASGLCKTVLITHGESGRSGVGRTRNVVAPTSLAGQFEQPYGPMGPPTLFTIPVLRYMIFPSPPRKRGARGRATRPGALGSHFARERRNRPVSNWRWSRSCSANGQQRTRALPSRCRSLSRRAELANADHRLPRPRSISSSSGAGGAGTAGFLIANRVPSSLSITPSSVSKRSSKV